LHDLVSYNEKHNEANARATTTVRATTGAGTAAWRARATTAEVLELRARQRRNLLATLVLSQGVPMLLGRRRARPHPARQQQRLLPGQRGLLVRLGGRRPRAPGVDPVAPAPPQGAPDLQARCAGSRARQPAA
jgi:glycogen operon protein